MKWYLAAMFAIPLLELWDRAMARITEKLDTNGAFSTDRWLIRQAGACGGRSHHEHWCVVWVVRIPWLRQWERRLNDNQYGWHKVFLVHATNHGWHALRAPIV